MKFSARLLISFLLLVTCYLLLVTSVAHANTTPQVNNYPVVNTNSDVPNNLHNWTQNVMIEVMSSLTCQLAGVDPINPKQGCLGIDSASGKIGFLPSPQTGGAIGFMGNMISVLYTPPLHTADYFRDLASNFGISKKTYAQTTGTGFQSLTPLISIWSAFRNIVYLFLVIIFVVIGLAIMLRVKIDPRTVMTIQNQIPKIIIGILAVTFSFAIAGFLIDMMWVLIYLFYGIFNGIQGIDVSSLNPSAIQGQTALKVAGHISAGSIPGITFNIAKDGSNIVREMLGIGPTFAELNPFNIEDVLDIGKFLKSWGGVLGVVPNLNVISNLISAVSGITSFLIGFKIFALPDAKILGNGLGWIQHVPYAIPAMIGIYGATNLVLRELLPFMIIYLIIFIALLTALFRLWFTLIMAYVQILLAVVLAPFWIIGGIVPGSPISLGGWLKDIGANLLAFPVTIAMFMLGKVFMDAFGECSPNLSAADLAACKAALANHFVPPLIGNPGDPSLIGSLIGLGILLMTPNVVNMLKQMLKAPKTDMMGSIGASLGAGAGTLTGGARSAGAYFVKTPEMGKAGGWRATFRNILKF